MENYCVGKPTIQNVGQGLAPAASYRIIYAEPKEHAIARSVATQPKVASLGLRPIHLLAIRIPTSDLATLGHLLPKEKALCYDQCKCAINSGAFCLVSFGDIVTVFHYNCLHIVGAGG